MNLLKSLFLAGLATSCAVAPPEFPPFEIPEASIEIQQPIPLPAKPLAVSSTENTITFDEQGIRELESYVQTATANNAISLANAKALEAQSLAFNSLLIAAEYQRQMGQIKSELLEQSRSNHKMDLWWYRGLLALIGGAALL